jgi:hypothetical protein
MGKYRSSATRRQKPKDQGPHFVWRGLGCVMMIIIPVISYAAATLTIDYGLAHNWAIPYQLLGAPRLPALLYKSNAIVALFSPLLKIQHLYAYLAVGVLYMMFISGVISIIYAAVYRVLGPSRWGPMDMPPPKFKPKKYTR